MSKYWFLDRDIENDNWCILVHTDGHNKFWAFKRFGNEDKYEVRYGKLRTSGVSMSVRGEYIRKKVPEKINKGYRIAEKGEIEQLFSEGTICAWNL